MNRIHSPLGFPGHLNRKNACIEWRQDNVPVITADIDQPAKEICSKYFELLFLNFHLLDRFAKYAHDLEHDAKSFYDYMFLERDDKGREVNRDRLLDLLIGDPRDNVKIVSLPMSKREKETIARVFNYSYLTKQYRNQFDEFIQMLGVGVCPYCGRAFTTTIRTANGNFVRANQVDHYLPKSKYPWLALSVWNFVPSCTSCNHRKGDESNPILYPYTEDIGDTYRFCTHPINSLEYLVGARDSENDFKVVLEPIDSAPKNREYVERAEAEIKLLGIRELYTAHNDHVSAVFRQRYVFATPYIDDLVTTFPDLFHSRGDVLSMLSMMRIDSNSIGNAPLDRLIRDINIEIDRFAGETTVPA